MASSSCAIKQKNLLIVIFIVTFMYVESHPDIGKAAPSPSNNYFGSYNNFYTRNNTKIVAQIGSVAVLPCTVRLTSSATVSWIRKKDYQLLTVGLSTYSSDERFIVEHTRHMGLWALRIKNVREEDKGLYECTLTTHPPESIFVELKVVEAIAEINGAPDVHIDESSPLRLECKLKRATENPSFVFWYHNYKMVNYDSHEGYIVSNFQPSSYNRKQVSSPPTVAASRNDLGQGLVTEEPAVVSNLVQMQQEILHPMSTILPSVISVLSINEAHFKHAGNYTCAPANTRPTSITVHVLRGEKPAAMQHANRSAVVEVKSNSSNLSSSLNRQLQAASIAIVFINLLLHLQKQQVLVR